VTHRQLSSHDRPPRGRQTLASRVWLGLHVLAPLGPGCTMDNPAFDQRRETAVADGPETGDVESGEENSGDGDPGDGDPGDGDPGDGDGDGDPGDGDGDPGDGDGEPACELPLTWCDGECVNLDEDLANCGSCGEACVGTCAGGDCLVESHRIMFAASSLRDGALGGLAGADAFCTELAADAGYNGLFMAWLSNAQLGPATRMTHFMGAYRLPNGELIANDWVDLTDGTLAHPINQDQFGNAPPKAAICQDDEVWSNTNSDGTPQSELDCNGWTSAAVSSTSNTGEWTAVDASWTESSCVLVSCAVPAGLYCVQQ
jgi:hypothetical protein